MAGAGGGGGGEAQLKPLQDPIQLLCSLESELELLQVPFSAQCQRPKTILRPQQLSWDKGVGVGLAGRRRVSTDHSSMGCGRSLPLAHSLAVRPTLSQPSDTSGDEAAAQNSSPSTHFFFIWPPQL